MTTYKAAIDDSIFILSKVLNWNKLFSYPAFQHVDEETALAILTEGAKFCEQVLSPINAIGDQQGSKLTDGKVHTPDGFKEVYQQYTEAGWQGLDMPEAYGGQGLPLSVQVAFAEMSNGACLSFSMLPIMLRAAASLLIEHADSALIDKVVPQLVSGEYAATICITEAQAGSDVGRIKTQAIEQQDGNYRLSGSKMFISFGDHDLSNQIIHLVLARTPEAAAGTRGISLFLVPKLDLESDEGNGVSVSRLERKMGLKASPTCVLDLDNAKAYRVGEESRGLQCMFTMVNLMRLETSIQGPAIASAACRRALDYSAERLQGGAPENRAIAIIEHADVRQMLFSMRARTEAMRALIYEAAFNLDIAAVEEDQEKVQAARQLAEFLLPVCKAAGSQTGFEVASTAIQVFGGHGYISDNGIEQYVRDARVTMIYEGSNGIQALDLLSRKVIRDKTKRYKLFGARVKADIENFRSNDNCFSMITSLEKGMSLLDDCTFFLMQRAEEKPRDIEAAASDYLQFVALIAGGWMWLRMMACVDTETDFSRTKLASGRYYEQYLMPEMAVFSERIKFGAETLDAISSEALRV
ncbi:MAG: acyl-CoA dehydrogenase [Gammaproteobacteria bacterium]|nr:acyl-CoA dehydrogenase [Gammaproteobacteria bacterium]